MVEPFEIFDLPPVVAVSAVVAPFEIFDFLPGIVETAVVEPPSFVVGAGVCTPLETVAVNAFWVANLGRPNFYVSPNICSFARHSSSVALVHEVLVGNPIDFPANDAPDSHSSSLRVSSYKKKELVHSSSSQNHSAASDTNLLPTASTTNHHRNRFPPLRQGRHKHSSQAARSTPVAQRTQWVEAVKC